MHKLDAIAETIRQSFDAENAARERALEQARRLTRACALAIRAVHREDVEEAHQILTEARTLSATLTADLQPFPALYYSGYTQDALKEFTEAEVVFALVFDRALPTPEDLHVEPATYLKGLSEAVGELRRRCLDILRGGYSPEVERLLTYMDDIFAVLVTMDYPDAITQGLRRLTDITRSLIERTRGDLTINLRQQHLENALQRLEQRLREIDR
ncbi:MAG: haloacid dehalogenase [Anaerolineales bacterium]